MHWLFLLIWLIVSNVNSFYSLEIGYHGTSSNVVENIIEENFIESTGRNHWFGNGVYFFVEGVNSIDLKDLAVYWGIDSAWDNDKKKYSSKNVSVLSALINIDDDKLLDMTDNRGVKLFNSFRDIMLRKVFEGKRKVKQNGYADWDVFEMMKINLGLEFVKGNVYIQFREMKISRIKSNVANCTILSVNLPSQNVGIETLTIEREEKIESDELRIYQ